MRPGLVLMDLSIAAALLWISLSDSWFSIGVTAALVLLRAVPHLLGRAAGG